MKANQLIEYSDYREIDSLIDEYRYADNATSNDIYEMVVSEVARTIIKPVPREVKAYIKTNIKRGY